MTVENKYEIEYRFISNKLARSRIPLDRGVQFLVAHETANNTADADNPVTEKAIENEKHLQRKGMK